MDRVDAGDARWIALVPLLAPGTDAGTAEELPIALAFALPKSPGAVLALLGRRSGFAVEDVCSAPFIEGTVKDIPGYVTKAEAAVSRVRARQRQERLPCRAEKSGPRSARAVAPAAEENRARIASLRIARAI